MILILTGPTRSHKTTTLRKWSDQRNDCGGVLSPDVDGFRVLYNITSGESIPWQKRMPESEADLIVGRFSFDPEAFRIAQGWLDELFNDPDIRQIILDEVGKLELKGQGWAAWLHSTIPKLGEKTLILVVRRSLLDEVINTFGMEEVSVVGKDYFTTETP